MKVNSPPEMARGPRISIGDGKVVNGLGATLTARDYRSLAELRHQIRLFAHFSEQAVRCAGLNPHELMLAWKGLPPKSSTEYSGAGQTASDPASQHRRIGEPACPKWVRASPRGDEDRREVLILLTGKGERVLRGAFVASQGRTSQSRTRVDRRAACCYAETKNLSC